MGSTRGVVRAQLMRKKGVERRSPSLPSGRRSAHPSRAACRQGQPPGGSGGFGARHPNGTRSAFLWAAKSAKSALLVGRLAGRNGDAFADLADGGVDEDEDDPAACRAHCPLPCLLLADGLGGGVLALACGAFSRWDVGTWRCDREAVGKTR
jgi:hypothetical protein